MTERFTDKEWEELASQLSDEKTENKELIDRLIDNGKFNTIRQWKELKTLGEDKEVNIDRAWDNLYKRINENLLMESKVSLKRALKVSVIIKAAAVALLVIAMGSAALYLNNSGYLSKTTIYTTGNDEKNLEIMLPDGSRITLNRNTELSYRSNFGKSSRDVRLSGEAFFEISADASKPFSIDAENAKVKVIGTSFNVNTRNDHSAVEVYVKTGKVLLTDNSGSKSIILDPEYIGTLDIKSTGKVINKNPNYMAWKTGLLVYKGEKLNIVFHDLRRVYNMDIIADDADILDYPWTFPTIDNQSQDVIIRLICASFNLSYSKEGDVYHLKKK